MSKEKDTSKFKREQQPPSLSSSGEEEEEEESDGNCSDKTPQEDNTSERKKKIHDTERTKLKSRPKNFSVDKGKNKESVANDKKRSITVTDKHEQTPYEASSTPKTASKPDSNCWKVIAVLLVISAIAVPFIFSNESSDSSPNDNDWRLKVDPNDALSNDKQHTLRASLKPILDKSSTKDGVSTLLILSSDEENAAKLARCLLRLVNTATHKAAVATEIDLKSHRGGKLQLDSNLHSLLSPGDTIRAVLLRHIDDNLSDNTFERARLLFAYCDGENPVIPHRLIIMTATSKSENELREKFKTLWSNEHDFVDALMSRISGHTLYIENNQKSIC